LLVLLFNKSLYFNCVADYSILSYLTKIYYYKCCCYCTRKGGTFSELAENEVTNSSEYAIPFKVKPLAFKHGIGIARTVYLY
jgi:hypothetical protein